MIDDCAYLANRFLTEQSRAQTASCPEAAAAHRELANAYQLRLRTLTPILDIRASQPGSVIMPMSQL